MSTNRLPKRLKKKKKRPYSFFRFLVHECWVSLTLLKQTQYLVWKTKTFDVIKIFVLVLFLGRLNFF